MSIVKVNWNPDAKALRYFGIGIYIFGALLGALAWHKGHQGLARAIGGACALLGSLTLSSKTLGKGIYTGWMSVALVIGTVVSTLALGVVYYLVLTPIGIAGRIMGRDPLRLKNHGTSSHFTPLAIPADKAYFGRLF